MVLAYLIHEINESMHKQSGHVAMLVVITNFPFLIDSIKPLHPYSQN